MNTFINEKLLPPVMKFVNTKAITAIKNGMLYPIPFIVIGAIFLILSSFPYTPIANYLSDIGLIVAILVGLFVGWSYSWFLKRNITIKMPEQVPANVAASFTALIPGAAIVTVATIIYGIFKLGFQTTIVEWIYTVIQTPLQHATDGPLGVVVVAFIPVFLWFFGVHGATIVGGIMTPLLLANNADNLALYKAGNLDVAHGAHIVTQAFMDQFITVTGSGMTIGLVIFMLIRARSVQMKTLGKLEIVPALFNINEPILFGLPLVLNPLMAVPFILAPLVSGFLTYGAIALGVIAPFNGLYVPWTTPAIISGLIVGGWQGALWQGLMLVVTGLLYWPFAMKYDKVLQDQEAAS